MYTVYALQSQTTGKIYIGQTQNEVSRELRHNQQLSFRKKSYTYKNKGPWKTVYKEEYYTRKEAITRERQLKSSRGRAFIKRTLKELVR